MAELGKKVGVTESAIGLYEKQKRKPDYEMLLKLSEALDCSVSDILGVNDYSTLTEMEYVTSKELEMIKAYRKATEKEKQSIHFILEDYING